MRQKLLRRFLACARGVSAVEFAYVLPVLTVLGLGAYEVPRALLIYQKVSRVTSELGDLVARQDVLTKAELSDLFDGADNIMEPFAFKSLGTVVISSITRPTSAAATIAWQCISDSSLKLGSRIGSAGKQPALPANFTVNTGDNVIVSEVFYNYVPVFGGYLFGNTKPFLSQVYYDVGYFRPRAATLSTISSGCP